MVLSPAPGNVAAKGFLSSCRDHRVIRPDEQLHRQAVGNLMQPDALLFGRMTYQVMEAAFRPADRTGAMPDWMEPFARTIDAAKKYRVSSTLDRVDRNAELPGRLAEPERLTPDSYPRKYRSRPGGDHSKGRADTS
jgi:hypothetical protein